MGNMGFLKDLVDDVFDAAEAVEERVWQWVDGEER